MKKLFAMRQALADPLLLADALRGPSWDAWRILLIAAVGEELTDDQRVVFKQFTGRDHEPGQMIDTWLTVSGRRSGKTTALSALVVYLSCLCDWTDDLSLGERGVGLYLAPTQDQAARAFRYARTFIEHSPLMKKLIVNQVASFRHHSRCPARRSARSRPLSHRVPHADARRSGTLDFTCSEGSCGLYRCL